MTDDLIERLRQEARDNYDEVSTPKCLWWEAAAEIEKWKQRALTADEIAAQFRAEVERLNRQWDRSVGQANEYRAEVERLRGALSELAEAVPIIGSLSTASPGLIERVRAALGDQLVDTNKVMTTPRSTIPTDDRNRS